MQGGHEIIIIERVHVSDRVSGRGTLWTFGAVSVTSVARCGASQKDT
jgi:hypothetical protein